MTGIETKRQASVAAPMLTVRRLSASVAVAFESIIVQKISEAPGDLIIDFNDIDFIDSSGLGTLVSLMKMANGKGKMTLCTPNPGVRDILTLARMDRIFRIHEGRIPAST